MSEEIKKTKILEILGDAISNGGQESFVINALKHMGAELSKFEIDILTPYYCDNQYYKSTIEKLGCSLICFNLPLAPGKNRFNLIKPIQQFFQTHYYDIVHIHAGSTSVLAECAFAAKRSGAKKIIVHSHCETVKSIKYILLKLMYGRTLNKVPTHYIACSPIEAAPTFSKKICRDKLIILKNGVDLNDFCYDPLIRDKIRTAYDIEKDCLVLGHVGRFSYQKNQEYLLSILSEMLENGCNVKLMLIGTGENLDKVQKLAKENNLDKNILFIGNVNNVNDYMQAMDVFVMPSRFEGLPIVGVEAQAVGLPCVFSDKISGETAITDHVVFLPIEDNSIEKWIDAIKKAREFPRENTSKIMKAKGFDINQTAKELISIYEN